MAKVIPEKASFVLGDTVELECITDGFPEPKISWLRANQLMIANEKVRVSGTRLTLLNMQRGDEGQYECLASNPAGEDRFIASLYYIGRCKL